MSFRNGVLLDLCWETETSFEISNEKTGGHEMLSGSMYYVAKPVDLRELTRCIEQRIRK